MAGFIAKTLLRHATAFHCLKKAATATTTTPCVVLAHRHRSSQATKPQFIDIELGSSSSSPATSFSQDEYEVALKLFDDLIQRTLVKKATPDWLPFVPGASFWVPPRPSHSNVANFIHKFTSDLSLGHRDDKPLPVANLRGWPSSQEFFVQDNESVHVGDTAVDVNSPEGMEVRVQVKVLTIPEIVALSEDEEG